MYKREKTELDRIGTWRYPMGKYSYEKNVLIKPTNLTGNTYFSNYIEWQGEARESFFLTHPAAKSFLKNYPHLALLTNSLYYRFIEESTFGDRLRIDLTTKEILDYSLLIVFRYYNSQTEKLIGEGWQKICFWDNNLNQPAKVPQLFLDLAISVREEEKSQRR